MNKFFWINRKTTSTVLKYFSFLRKNAFLLMFKFSLELLIWFWIFLGSSWKSPLKALFSTSKSSSMLAEKQNLLGLTERGDNVRLKVLLKETVFSSRCNPGVLGPGIVWFIWTEGIYLPCTNCGSLSSFAYITLRECNWTCFESCFTFVYGSLMILLVDC